MQEKIIELLGHGIPAVQVAAAVGCSESYISQLLSDQQILEQVQALRLQRSTGYVTHDTRIDTLEKRALEKVESLLPMITRPMEALKVFSTLNGAHRKVGEGTLHNSAPATVIAITLPDNAAVSLKLSVEKQVLEVDGRSMATMPARTLAKQLEQKKAAEQLETVQISSFKSNKLLEAL